MFGPGARPFARYRPPGILGFMGGTAPDFQLLFEASPDVLLVQPNYIRRATASGPPNDPWWLFGFLWGVERVQAQPAWSLTTGDAGVVVADIDTGVDYTHPDLAANMWRNSGEVASNGIDDDGKPVFFLVATHHAAYDWQQIADHAKLVVDSRGALRNVKGRRDHIVSA